MAAGSWERHTSYSAATRSVCDTMPTSRRASSTTGTWCTPASVINGTISIAGHLRRRGPDRRRHDLPDHLGLVRMRRRIAPQESYAAGRPCHGARDGSTCSMKSDCVTMPITWRARLDDRQRLYGVRRAFAATPRRVRCRTPPSDHVPGHQVRTPHLAEAPPEGLASRCDGTGTRDRRRLMSRTWSYSCSTACRSAGEKPSRCIGGPSTVPVRMRAPRPAADADSGDRLRCCRSAPRPAATPC